MYKIIFTFLLLFLLFSADIFSQYNNEISAGKAPWIPQNTNLSNRFTLINPYTTGFAYSASGSNSQLFRFKVGTPGITTLIGIAQSHFLGNGDFANPTGVWKYYVQEQLTAPYTIYEVDTATGNLTSVGAPVNLKPGHMPIDMEWDHTTNTMYMVSANNTLTETQFYSMYWPTKALTWIGSPVTSPTAIIAGAFNGNGNYFGIDLISDALWKINKYTGAWSQVGPLGYNVNYAQDAAFDRTDFSKMLWAACGSTVGLYEVDTVTGVAALIGTFPYTQVMAMGFAAPSGPQISLVPLPNTPNLLGPYVVNAVITPGGSGISAAKLFWSRNSSPFDSVNMTNSSGLNWTGSFPGNGSNATYRYYVWVKDSLNRTATAPIGAPASHYSFIAMSTDTSKPVITHTPVTSAYKTDWPISLSASVTDNFGIDSVWVRWRINSGTTKQFKLLNTSGNIYSAIFNSVNADVIPGDQIYYRIIAQDNSAQHNKDSTVQYNLTILVFPYSCAGTGNVQISNGSPYNTYWWGARTQLLYLASELIANGSTAGVVTKIGFNIYSASSQAMNGFKVNMQNTTLTNLTGFENSNWFNSYTGTYTVPGTGWQYLTFSAPYFYWDGVSNLLVEICFSNSSYTTASVVLGTAMTGKVYTEYHDQPNACAFSAPSAISNRPNVCFMFVPISSTGTNSGIIPAEYKLSQNYPNPFNPVTRISFDIPKNGFVSLKIFDVLGREVKSLVSEVKQAGSYSVDFDASALPSGMYFYRLESKGYADTKRMVLIK